MKGFLLLTFIFFSVYYYVNLLRSRKAVQRVGKFENLKLNDNEKS